MGNNRHSFNEMPFELRHIVITIICQIARYQLVCSYVHSPGLGFSLISTEIFPNQVFRSLRLITLYRGRRNNSEKLCILFAISVFTVNCSTYHIERVIVIPLFNVQWDMIRLEIFKYIHIYTYICY